jgi:O-antigen biosynthesis protein
VIIVNYNVKYFLEQCLLSVQKAIEGLDAEVFVVDNNSVDGSVKMVSEKFLWTQLIANKENTGFSKANNQAIQVASGEYILLLNPDTVVEEDTFRKVIRFMDEHPEAGGLGVKMVDGKGNFLPESKRGLPTPAVAFYKIFGLSRLFPKSPRFGRYHLGHLSNNQVHEVEILSGAFMCMRKKTLEEVGYLDEAFFMYGEDIDLSWRIILGGWKNYYFPETRIIHYKGESTKKGSLNYVYVFYNAMVIFAKKHFSPAHAKWFSFFIHLAIWMRAGMAILYRFLTSMVLPVLDGALTFAGIWGIKTLYSQTQHIPYDPALVTWTLSVCAAVWMIAAFFRGAYDRPLRPLRIIKPIIAGSACILIVYSLLPEHLRFSRAILLSGTVVALAVFLINRILINVLTTGNSGITARKSLRLAIVGFDEEVSRVKAILGQTAGSKGEVMSVSPGDDVPAGYQGTLRQLNDIVRVHNLDQVIFCAKDLSSSSIIGAMSSIDRRNLEFRIAPPESLYIIGSNSIETSGDSFMLDVNSISRPGNRRLKRLFDILVGILLLILTPFLFWLPGNSAGLLRNIVLVLSGRRTWVGFCPLHGGTIQAGLPLLRKGVLHPLVHLPPAMRTSEHIQKLNALYAKDYQLRNDIFMVWKGLAELGSKK